jgi:Holliday junction DNA helicase RuvA
MIAYIQGKVVWHDDSRVILDVHDMGYQVFITSSDAEKMPAAGTQVKLHTYLNVKEDAMQLFGFLSRDDMEVFKLLLTVNGIGPKAALGVLSVLSADDLRFAVLADDSKTIARAPGIGKKTAQKLILELKDKLSLEEAFEKKLEHETGAEETFGAGKTDASGDAVQALVALGYSNADALRAVKRTTITEDMDTEAILRAALKNLTFL